MNSLNDIWNSVLDSLGEGLTATSRSTWFGDCTPVELINNRLVVHTPTDFKRDIIQTRYAPRLEEALRDLFSSEIRLVVLSGDELESYLAETRTDDTLPEVAGFTFDNFVVGPSNKYAHAAAIAVSENMGRVYNPLFIYGPSGLGKTHLLYAIAARLQERFPDYNIVYINSETFTNELITALREHKNVEFRKKYRNADLLLMDDIQFIGGKASTEEEFFHTFNELFAARKQIVLTSDRPPAEIALLADRLRTRFEGGLICDIIPPDYETRMAIIQNKADSLNLVLPDDVCNYIAENITNNIRQLEGTVKKIKAYHDLSGMPLDLPNVSRAIKDMFKDSTTRNLPTPALIISEVSRFYSVEESVIRSRLKSSNVVLPRQVAMYLIRTLTNLSLPDIGKEFGRDHTTVLSSLRRVESMLAKKDTDLEDNIRDITASINSKL